MQFPVLQPLHRGCGCNCTRQLAKREQLHQRSALDDLKNIKQNSFHPGQCDHNCTLVASTAMVSTLTTAGNCTPTKTSIKQSNNDKKNSKTRTTKELQVQDLCLADTWRCRLRSRHWSEPCIDRFMRNWAPSTISIYSKKVTHFIEYCEKYEQSPTSVSSGTVTSYLLHLTENSVRPKSTLTVTTAALNAFFRASGVTSPIDDEIYDLVNGLIKSGTSQPLMRSKVMPRTPFMKLFHKWGDNHKLSLWAMRLKAVTLLALAMMLRPCDVAPRSLLVTEKAVTLSSPFLTSPIYLKFVPYPGNNLFLAVPGFNMILPVSLSGLCPVLA